MDSSLNPFLLLTDAAISAIIPYILFLFPLNSDCWLDHSLSQCFLLLKFLEDCGLDAKLKNKWPWHCNILRFCNMCNLVED